MKFYLDASTIIYSIEGAPPLRDTVLARLLKAEQSQNGLFLTSRLARLECRVKPLKQRQAQILATYDQFFLSSSVALIEVGPNIIERATDLRARYGLKTPDAIHAATAVEEHADIFLTGDKGFLRCADLKVEVF